MVLKLFILCFLFFQANAYESIKASFLNNNYEDVIDLFEEEYEEFKEAPVEELNYYALSLKNQRDYIKAHNIFSYLLKTNHQNELIKVRKGEDASDNLISIISNMLDSYHHLYLEKYQELNKENKLKLKKTISRYEKALEKLPNYDGDLIDDLAEERDVFFERKEHKKYHWKHSFALIYQLYQFDLTITGEDDSNDLLANNRGPGLSYRISRENEFNRFYFDLAFSRDESVISNQGGNLNFTLRDGETNSTAIELGWMRKFRESRASVGFYALLFRREGDYASPDGFEITELSNTSFGGGIVTEYDFYGNFSFFLKLGNTRRIASALWQFGARYTF